MPTPYYINRNDKIRGPFSEERIRELYAEGKLRDTDFLSTRSHGGWEPVNVILDHRPTRRATAKVKIHPTAAVKSSRRSLWIVLAVAVAALTGVGIWRFGVSRHDATEVATTPSVPSEIVSQPSHDNPQAGREAERSITVEFGGLAGASIGWVVDGKLERRQVAVPGKQEFQFNTRQHLYIDNVRLEGLEGVAFYPTLEIRQLPDNPAHSPERAGIKLDLTGDDFAAANAGVLVTKVWYTKSGSPTVIEMLNNSSLHLGADLEAVASAEGSVVAVFHMGNRSRNLQAPALSTSRAPAQADALGSAIDQQSQTIQLRLIGLDGMSIGWVSEGKEHRNQLFVPGRTEVRVGEPVTLILENVPIAGWEGVSLFPTLVIRALNRSTAIFLEHMSIPIEFTERDLLSMRENPGGTRIIAYDPTLRQGPRSSGNPSPIIAFSLGDPAALNEQSRNDLVLIASLTLGDPGPNRSAKPVLPSVAPQESKNATSIAAELSSKLSPLGGRAVAYRNHNDAVASLLVNLGLWEDSKPRSARIAASEAAIKVLAEAKNYPVKLYLNGDGQDYSVQALQTIFAIPQLQTLNVKLRFDAIDDALCQALATKNLLRAVSLQSASITDHGLSSLAEIELLDHLELSDAHITDAGIKSLLNHAHLQQLTLRNCKLVTNQAIPAIKSIPKLTRLVLSDTGISVEAISTLRASRPGLAVGIAGRSAWLSRNEFQADFNANRDAGLRVTDVWIQYDSGTRNIQYSAEWQRSDGIVWFLKSGLTDQSLETEKATRAAEGYTVARIRSASMNGQKYHIVLWTRDQRTAVPPVSSDPDSSRLWLNNMLTQPIQAGVVDYPDEVSLKVVLDAIASNVSENYGNGQRLTIEADPGSFQKAGLNSLSDIKVSQLKLPPLSVAEALTATLSRIPNTKLKHIIKDDKIVIMAE